ncbi:unnamed protein product, partial [Ixodes persulcatus]
ALNKGCLQHACQYQDATGQYRCPKWVDLNSQGKYKPSYNISPRTYHSARPVAFSVVLNSTDKLRSSEWFAALIIDGSSYFSWRLFFFAATCRINEKIVWQQSFKKGLFSGNVCVTRATGVFFEWHKEDKTSRQPYLVYFRQPKAVSMAVRTWDGVSDAHQLMQGGQWAGPRLLTMAGLFDVSTCEEDLYSFTILTMDSPKYLQWLHDRVPVILSGEDAIAEWLDPNNSFEKLTRSVHCPKDLEWHPVSSEVGKVTNNSVKCVLPISKTAVKKEKQTSLEQWFKNSPKSVTKAAKELKRSRSRSPRSSSPGPSRKRSKSPSGRGSQGRSRSRSRSRSKSRSPRRSKSEPGGSSRSRSRSGSRKRD